MNNKNIKAIEKTKMSNPKNLKDLADTLSKECYGMSLDEAHKKKVCIQCRKKVSSFEDDESRAGYEIMGLCSICQKEFPY